MTQAGARILLDSISPAGDRLTTMEVVFWRPVLAEYNTHRAFSRNSASSRAIPFSRMLQRVQEDLAYPLVWASEQKGMSGGDEVENKLLARLTWEHARDAAVEQAKLLSIQGVHKSVCNRLLEPFLWHTAIVSSTSWSNFFRQRCSPLAQPEIRAVAEAMEVALAGSVPELLVGGEWHMPLLVDDDGAFEGVDPRKISAARCARVSYLTHEGVRDLSEDLALFNRLASAVPPHASPLEHVATPGAGLGNFEGWRQLRHEVFSEEG